MEDIPYEWSTNARQRTEAIQQFTHGTTKVFLISLKAGWFGLNLNRGAHDALVRDPWWNPAAEAQACLPRPSHRPDPFGHGVPAVSAGDRKRKLLRCKSASAVHRSSWMKARCSGAQVPTTSGNCWE